MSELFTSRNYVAKKKKKTQSNKQNIPMKMVRYLSETEKTKEYISPVVKHPSFKTKYSGICQHSENRIVQPPQILGQFL